MASGHDIAMALRAAYWAMHRRTNANLACLDVTADQLVLLALLAERDGVTQQDLVRRASSDRNTVRAMLVLMENGGLVTRGPHPADGRARSVTLTRKGRQRYARLSAEIRPLQDRLLRAFRPLEARSLVAFLTRISEEMTFPEGGRGRPRAAALPNADGKRRKPNPSRRTIP